MAYFKNPADGRTYYFVGQNIEEYVQREAAQYGQKASLLVSMFPKHEKARGIREAATAKWRADHAGKTSKDAASAGVASEAQARYVAQAKAAAAAHAANAAERAARYENLYRKINRLEEQIKQGGAEVNAYATDETGAPVDQAGILDNSPAFSEDYDDTKYFTDEVEVKSDFSKWFLVGGGVLLAWYLLRGKKK